MSQKLHEALMQAQMTKYDEDVLLDVAGMEKGGVIYGAALMTCAQFLAGRGFLTRATFDITDAGRELAGQIYAERYGVEFAEGGVKERQFEPS